MLRKLILKNFQAHTHKVLNFESGVNSIAGDSDRGKSSILRALRWLMLNKPSGHNWITHGKKFTKVILYSGEGVRFVRSRTASKNRYRMEGKVFAAFGTKVPGPIERELNVGQINFQNQLDGPFWFNLSPSDVAKKINEIVDLTLIDKVAAFTGSLVRGKRKEEEVCKSRLELSKAELLALQHIPQMITEFKSIGATRKRYRQTKETRQALEQMLFDLNAHDKVQRQEIPDVSPVEDLRIKLRKVRDARRKLETDLNDLEWNEKEFTALEETARQAEKAFHKFDGICPLCQQNLPH